MSAAQRVGIQLVLSEADTVAEAKPGELPFEQPTRYSVVINLKTAKARGLTIPPALLHQAEEVIQ